MMTFHLHQNSSLVDYETNHSADPEGAAAHAQNCAGTGGIQMSKSWGHR